MVTLYTEGLLTTEFVFFPLWEGADQVLMELEVLPMLPWPCK